MKKVMISDWVIQIQTREEKAMHLTVTASQNKHIS